MTARRTQREGLTWVSDRDVEIKLPVTLHRCRRRPLRRPSYGGFQILAVSAVASFAAGLDGDISTCRPRVFERFPSTVREHAALVR